MHWKTQHQARPVPSKERSLVCEAAKWPDWKKSSNLPARTTKQNKTMGGGGVFIRFLGRAWTNVIGSLKGWGKGELFIGLHRRSLPSSAILCHRFKDGSVAMPGWRSYAPWGQTPIEGHLRRASGKAGVSPGLNQSEVGLLLPEKLVPCDLLIREFICTNLMVCYLGSEPLKSRWLEGPLWESVHFRL